MNFKLSAQMGHGYGNTLAGITLKVLMLALKNYFDFSFYNEGSRL